MRRIFATLALVLAFAGQLQGAHCPMRGAADTVHAHDHGTPAHAHEHHATAGSQPEVPSAPHAPDSCAGAMVCGALGVVAPAEHELDPTPDTTAAGFTLAGAAAAPYLAFDPPPPKRFA